MLDGYTTSELLWQFDGWKLLNQLMLTCYRRMAAAGRETEGSGMIETSVTTFCVAKYKLCDLRIDSYLI